MKVIFIQDVSGVAKRNSIKEVADGFALNYLLPRGLVVRATSEKIQAMAEHQESVIKQDMKTVTRSHQLANEIKGKTVIINRPASSTGTLYASITAEMVAEALKQQHQIGLLSKQISVPVHIKTIGAHQVKVILGDKIESFLNLQINAT